MINSIRNWFWTFPELIFFGDKSLVFAIWNLYKSAMPFSTAIVIIAAVMGFFQFAISNSRALLFQSENTFIEGVVVGIDSDTGRMQQINKISPLTSDSSKTRLERDLIELMYEGLIRVDQKGEPEPALAGFLEVEKGRRYQFRLKDDLYWHDGTPITADDVIATFNLVQQLEQDPATSTIYSKAADKLEIIRSETDTRSFEFRVKGNKVVPGFFEAISFKILPAHLLKDVTPANINGSAPYINRNPIGSGPFRFFRKSDDSLELVRNDNYHGTVPQIQRIRFRFFVTEQDAVHALKTGQIHAFIGASLQSINELKLLDSMAVAKSNVLYNQYWAIYFNLNGSSDIVKDVKVRQAVNQAVDKASIVNDVLQGYGEVANGPIPPISFAYSPNYVAKFDVDVANTLLENAGWKIDPATGFRAKDGKPLVIRLSLINNPDRIAVAEFIRNDLTKIGVDLIVEAHDSQGMQDILTGRTFEALLYGTQTFIDPDRYQLFHSKQIADPGLNISSWSSSELKGVIGDDGKIVRIPESDDALDKAASSVDEAQRAKSYKDFQRLMAKDMPVVFLYYPEEVYIYNRRLTNLVLTDLISFESRFINVNQWKIDL